MLDIIFTADYKKGRKLMKKRGADLNLLDRAIKLLSEQKSLSTAYRDHPLQGTNPIRRDLHIKPDWLLIYRIDPKSNRLILYDTGTHSDLFNLSQQEVPYF